MENNLPTKLLIIVLVVAGAIWAKSLVLGSIWPHPSSSQVAQVASSNNIYTSASGNVGIGTQNPQYLLHLGPGAPGTNLTGRLNGLLISNVQPAGFAVTNTTSGVSSLWQNHTNGLYLGTTSNHPLIMRTNDQDRLTIESDGRIGVGTRTPSEQLEVNDTDGNDDVRINLRANPSSFGQLGMSSSQMFVDTKAKPFYFYTSGLNSPQVGVEADGNLTVRKKLCLGPSNDCRDTWPSGGSNVCLSAPNVSRINTSVPNPNCSQESRGMMWFVPGGNLVADQIRVCTKNSLNGYAWRII